MAGWSHQCIDLKAQYLSEKTIFPTSCLIGYLSNGHEFHYWPDGVARLTNKAKFNSQALLL